ncbi:MAG TPA: DUF1697 domain-containing protein [Gemmatimonadaceae bacterium]|nr:DUF1697 domain-containing protein [Gemmatimonadaceae bacterium]
MSSTVRAAFLRGINVGGNKLVSMAGLKTFFEDLGFTDVKTLLQSGNVVFRGKSKNDSQLERLLEKEAQKHLKLECDFMVRSPADLERVVKNNPFPREAKSNPSGLIVLFLKTEAEQKHIDDLTAAIVGSERVEGIGRETYIYYGEGMGRSRLTNAVIEKRVGRATGRNWNTVGKVLGLMHSA